MPQIRQPLSLLPASYILLSSLGVVSGVGMLTSPATQASTFGISTSNPATIPWIRVVGGRNISMCGGGLLLALLGEYRAAGIANCLGWVTAAVDAWVVYRYGGEEARGKAVGHAVGGALGLGLGVAMLWSYT